MTGGSVAEWLKAHDSKSCGRVTVSEVRILSLPPLKPVSVSVRIRIFDANPLASAIFYLLISPMIENSGCLRVAIFDFTPFLTPFWFQNCIFSAYLVRALDLLSMLLCW